VALSGRLFGIVEPGPLVREDWVAGRRPEGSPARPRRVVCVRGLHPAGGSSCASLRTRHRRLWACHSRPSPTNLQCLNPSARPRKGGGRKDACVVRSRPRVYLYRVSAFYFWSRRRGAFKEASKIRKNPPNHPSESSRTRRSVTRAPTAIFAYSLVASVPAGIPAEDT